MLRVLAATVFTLSAIACGDGPAFGEPTTGRGEVEVLDFGFEDADAGSAEDAGISADAGLALDGGLSADAGPSVDAGGGDGGFS